MEGKLEANCMRKVWTRPASNSEAKEYAPGAVGWLDVPELWLRVSEIRKRPVREKLSVLLANESGRVLWALGRQRPRMTNDAGTLLCTMWTAQVIQ